MSPVIATVILVGVTIAVTLTAAYWFSGTLGNYMRFETIEIANAYCTLDSSVNNSRWRIMVSLKNSGSNPSIIQYMMLNDMLIDEFNISAGGSLTNTNSVGTSLPADGLILRSGESAIFYVWIGSDLFSTGTSVAIRLHSVSGIDYIRQLKLT